MVRQSIVVLLACFAYVSSVLAGTWADNFDKNNLNNWQISPENAQVEIKDGKVVITSQETGTPSAIYFNNGQEVRDFTLTVDSKIARGIDNNEDWDYMCITGREDADAEVCAWFSMEMQGNLPVVILHWPQGNCCQNFARRDIPFLFELGKWYHIQVDMKGDVFSIAIDNKLIAESDWSNQPMLPEIGMVSIGAGGAEVHFDNFTITGAEVPDNDLPVEAGGHLATAWGNIKNG